MKRTYQPLLPLSTEDTIINQFGWLPVSIFKPDKGKDWDIYFKDEGDPIKTRRSESSKYLPKLRFSRFNPRLAEIVIRYWSLKGDTIVDPFSGRSTRGVISLILDRNYIGYEIVPQIARKTEKDILGNKGNNDFKIWIDDGCEMRNTESGIADLVFTCPPYHQLERYESIFNQLSDIKEYNDFIKKIKITAKNIWRVAKNKSFLCWVCADWRDGKAFRLFHRDSIDIFENIGFKIHDIVVIENISPFASLQAGKVAAKRYTSKIHEYLLVFRKILK